MALKTNGIFTTDKMSKTIIDLSKEKQLEEHKFSCLIRWLRANEVRRIKILKRWEISKGKQYVKDVKIELNSNRHMR